MAIFLGCKEFLKPLNILYDVVEPDCVAEMCWQGFRWALGWFLGIFQWTLSACLTLFPIELNFYNNPIREVWVLTNESETLNRKKK